MTLKQFIELAIGLVGAWLIFNSDINLLIKWMAAPLLAFFGFALAFIPIEDRPLDQWIINFFKAIYKPTQFTFQAKVKDLNIFTQTKPKSQTSQIDLPPAHQLEDYLQTLPPTPATNFDQAETKYLDHISNLFGALGTPVKKIKTKDVTDTPLVKSPIKGVRVRKLNTPQMCLLPHATVYQTPSDNYAAAMPIQTTTTNLGAPVSAAVGNTPKTTKNIGKVYPANTGPKPKPIKVQKTATNNLGAPVSTTVGNTPKSTKPLQDLPDKYRGQPSQPATFAKDIILPQAHERPNLLAGITLDQSGKIAPNVIMEIRDSKNHPVRALKSNKLGQFFISTALPDGVYHLQAEHADHKFATLKLEAKGEIIPPLKIQATS